MHKFLRAAGFSMYQKNKDIRALLRCLSKNAAQSKCIQIDRDTSLYEVKAEVAPGIGIAMYGELDEKEELDVDYYFPYLTSTDITSSADCSIQRHAEKETYAGLLDEYRVGISLIFYLLNSMEYREHFQKYGNRLTMESACLSGLAVHGKVLLPIKKTAMQIEKAKVASRNRDNLLEAAKNGDEDAMESLTIEDIDLYSQASRRVMKEDIYSIVDTCFMPSGIECDQYSVLGEIKEVLLKKNRITGEEIYDLKLECNDLIFRVGINKMDLLGEPQPGRRFKGKIWMMGSVNFAEKTY
ncbi:MAG: DUF3881 family protein [Clostridium sp.]|nr:DUF3881 family protein [Clostridium sp.]